MNFSQAFRYPFQNFAKVMSIVLVLTIAFAVFIAMILNSHDWSPLLAELYGIDAAESNAGAYQTFGGTTVVGLVGLLLVAIVSGFWLSGYSVEVIRSVTRDEEWMPGVNFARNIKDGALLFVSSIAYWLLFILLIIVLSIAYGVLGRISVFGALAVLVSVALLVYSTCVLGWAYFVGMARFALEGDYRASWQISRNIRVARRNWRKGLTLLLYMIALSIIYGIAREIVAGVFGGIIGANLLAGITVSIIIYYLFNLMQHFSTQVMITQYAAEIGMRSDRYDPEKDKGVIEFTQE